MLALPSCSFFTKFNRIFWFYY